MEKTADITSSQKGEINNTRYISNRAFDKKQQKKTEKVSRESSVTGESVSTAK